MAAITAAMVGELRAKTDAPMMECKKALTEADGDMAKAEEILRVKLGSKAGKAASRVTAEGVITAFINGTTGALVEVNCETDFVAKSEDFQNFVKDVAMHVAAADPKFVRSTEMDQAFIDREVAIYTAQLKEEGKPEAMLDNIAKGKINRFFKDNTLVNQDYIKDSSMSVSAYVKSVDAGLTVTGFKRAALG